LLVIGVAFCGYSIMAWSSQAEARSDRSTLEVGPSTVLTVAPLPPARLLQAVRAADPTGRYAMAATQYSIADSPMVLAIDSYRLAAVVPQGPSGSDAALAAALKPAPVHQIEVTGGSIRLSLDASHVTNARPTYVVAAFSGATGPVAGVFGPLTNGSHSYTAAMPACTSSRPCALVEFQLSGSPSIATVAGSATAGTVVVLQDLRQTGFDDGADRSLFGPAGIAGAQWRTATDSTAVGPIMTRSSAGLSLTVPMPTYPKSEALDATAYLLNVPLPLPAVVAGSPALTLEPGVLAVQPFGFNAVPVTVSQTRAVLPRIENSGVLIDLDYAQAVSGLAEGGQVSEVWLAAGTPMSVLRALAAQGVIRTGSDTIATRSATYAAEPQVVGLRFQLVAGLISLALAAAALLLVASVERGPRAADLVALRRQGISARVARGVAIGAYAVLAVAALIFGFFTAIIDRFASGSIPPFRDGWHVLARPPTLPPMALLTGVAITVVVLGCAAVLSAHQVTRAVRNEMKEAGQP